MSTILGRVVRSSGRGVRNAVGAGAGSYGAAYYYTDHERGERTLEMYPVAYAHAYSLLMPHVDRMLGNELVDGPFSERHLQHLQDVSWLARRYNLGSVRLEKLRLEKEAGYARDYLVSEAARRTKEAEKKVADERKKHREEGLRKRIAKKFSSKTPSASATEPKDTTDESGRLARWRRALWPFGGDGSEKLVSNANAYEACTCEPPVLFAAKYDAKAETSLPHTECDVGLCGHCRRESLSSLSEGVNYVNSHVNQTSSAIYSAVAEQMRRTPVRNQETTSSTQETTPPVVQRFSPRVFFMGSGTSAPVREIPQYYNNSLSSVLNPMAILKMRPHQGGNNVVENQSALNEGVDKLYQKSARLGESLMPENVRDVVNTLPEAVRQVVNDLVQGASASDAAAAKNSGTDGKSRTTREPASGTTTGVRYYLSSLPFALPFLSEGNTADAETQTPKKEKSRFVRNRSLAFLKTASHRSGEDATFGELPGVSPVNNDGGKASPTMQVPLVVPGSTVVPGPGRKKNGELVSDGCMKRMSDLHQELQRATSAQRERATSDVTSDGATSTGMLNGAELVQYSDVLLHAATYRDEMKPHTAAANQLEEIIFDTQYMTCQLRDEVKRAENQKVGDLRKKTLRNLLRVGSSASSKETKETSGAVPESPSAGNLQQLNVVAFEEADTVQQRLDETYEATKGFKFDSLDDHLHGLYGMSAENWSGLLKRHVPRKSRSAMRGTAKSREFLEQAFYHRYYSELAQLVERHPYMVSSLLLSLTFSSTAAVLYSTGGLAQAHQALAAATVLVHKKLGESSALVAAKSRDVYLRSVAFAQGELVKLQTVTLGDLVTGVRSGAIQAAQASKKGLVSSVQMTKTAMVSSVKMTQTAVDLTKSGTRYAGEKLAEGGQRFVVTPVVDYVYRPVVDYGVQPVFDYVVLPVGGFAHKYAVQPLSSYVVTPVCSGSYRAGEFVVVKARNGAVKALNVVVAPWRLVGNRLGINLANLPGANYVGLGRYDADHGETGDSAMGDDVTIATEESHEFFFVRDSSPSSSKDSPRSAEL